MSTEPQHPPFAASTPHDATTPVLGTERSPNVVALLTIVTLGLYLIYWWYTVNREMRDFARTVQPTHPLAASSPGTSTLAVTLGALIIVPVFVTAHSTARRVCEAMEDLRVKALTRLAGDLGFPKVWAESAREARDVHREGLTWRRAALAAAGVAALMAAPALVLVAAPAGLAGGAAIVAGLAALGPGGMLGGVAIVGLVGGAGGAAAATALTSGSAAQVQRNVVHLQALAKASRWLGHAAPGHREWSS